MSPLTQGIADLLAPLRNDPDASAILCDIDGTLATIVADPADAFVPAETQRALRALAGRFALVACVSGRRAADARKRVGVEELTYAGNHGLELLEPGATEVAVDPAIGAGADAVRAFVRGLDAGSLRGSGFRLEDKGPIQALHWRGVADPDLAEERALEIAAAARGAGLEPRLGRRVLELRPTAEIDKGTTVRGLLDRSGASMALFAGDDRTDLDAFDALRSMLEEGVLRVGLRIGVSSEEAPPGLESASDAVVSGPEELRVVLEALAAAPRRSPAGRG